MTEAEWVSETAPAPLLRFVEDRLTDRLRLLFMAGCCRRVWELFTDHRFRRVVEVAEDLADGRATQDELVAVSEQVPRPGQRVPPPPNPLLQDALVGQWRTFHLGGRVNPSGVLNFHDLPTWCQQTYHAVMAVAPRGCLRVAECCEMAAGHHAGDRVAEAHPLHAEIGRLRDEVRQGHRKADDYRWRGARRLHDETVAAVRQLERDTDAKVEALTNEIWSAGADERISRANAERAAQTDLVRCLIGNPFRAAPPDPAWLTATVVALVRGIDAERAFDRLPILADALMDAGCDRDDVLSHCRESAAHTKGCWVVEMLRPRAA